MVPVAFLGGYSWADLEAARLPSGSGAWLVAAVVGVIFLCAVVIASQLWRRRRRRGSIGARLTRVSEGILSGFLIPNVDTSHIQIEYALLAKAGVIIVDIKDVTGLVFAGETMQEWTVMTRNGRFTFNNPLPALYDRIAAVKRVIADIPVQGFVVFTNGAKFPKGMPAQVRILDEFIAQLGKTHPSHERSGPEVFLPAWQRLREEAVALQVGQFLKG